MYALETSVSVHTCTLGVNTESGDVRNISGLKPESLCHNGACNRGIAAQLRSFG